MEEEDDRRAGSPRCCAPCCRAMQVTRVEKINTTSGQSETNNMVRKVTVNKSAAKKADARKHAAPKSGARSSLSSAKAAARKVQPANVHAKGAAKPAAKTDHASKV